MKNTFMQLLSALLISSCATTHSPQEVSGLYRFKEPYFICQIELMHDSTFEYSCRGDLINQKSTGTWKLVQDTLVLKSKKMFGIKEAFEELQPTNDSIKIEVWGEWSDTTLLPFGLGSVKVFENNLTPDSNANLLSLNEDGIGFIKRQSIDHMSLHYLGDTYTYRTRNNSANNFKLIVLCKDSGYEYFDSEKWLIRKRSLVRENDFVFKKVK